VLVQVERIFWRCVQTGEVPRVFGAAPPRAKLPLVRVVDMGTSNAWAEYVFVGTQAAHGARFGVECGPHELEKSVPRSLSKSSLMFS
jgi:hypothetical protein